MIRTLTWPASCLLQSAQSGSGGDEGADEVGEAFFQPHASQRGDRDGTRRWETSTGFPPAHAVRALRRRVGLTYAKPPP